MQNNVSHFPHLAKEIVKFSQKYAEYIDILINEFQFLFQMSENENVFLAIQYRCEYSSRRLSNAGTDLKNGFSFSKHIKFFKIYCEP